MLFVFEFQPVCNFGKFINFGLGTVRNEGVNGLKMKVHSAKNYSVSLNETEGTTPLVIAWYLGILRSPKCFVY